MNKIILILIFSFILINFVNAECFPEYKCGEWGDCIDGLRSKICIDQKCDAEDITEREFCGESDCEPEVECERWGTCNYFDKTNDIIKEELRFEGTKERICFDKANCVDSFTERESCSLAIPIKVQKTEWCGEELVEIFDSSNNIVGRVKGKKISKNLNRIDISFITETSPDYCSYCFDGEQNHDETNVDCGGASCPKCIEKINFIDWSYWVILGSWIILSFLFTIFIGGSLMNIGQEGTFIEGMKNFLRLVKPLTDKEAQTREEQIINWIRTRRKISSD